MKKSIAFLLCWLSIIPAGPALILALLASFAPVHAQTSIHVRYSYATETALCYDAVDDNTTPYTVIVATDVGLTDVINDFNATLYSGSDVDLTRLGTVIEGGATHTRCIAVGHDFNQYASDNNSYSRATPANTTLYYSINGVTGSFTTTNPPLGQSYGRGHIADTTHPGRTMMPTFSWTNRAQTGIDAQTGMPWGRVTIPTDNYGYASTTPTGCTGSLATWLTCTGYSFSSSSVFNEINTYAANLKSAWCSANCGSAGARDVEVQISYDKVNFSNSVTATLGTSSADQLVYADGTTTPADGVPYPGTDLPGLVSLTWEPEYISNSGSSTTVNLSGTSVCPQLTVGTFIRAQDTSFLISGLDCVSMPNTITLNNPIDATAPTGLGVYTGFYFNNSLTIRVRQKNPGTGSTLNVSSVDFWLRGGNATSGASGAFIDRWQQTTYMDPNIHLGILGGANGYTPYVYSFDDSTKQVRLLGAAAIISGTCGLDETLYLDTTGEASIGWDPTTPGLLWSLGLQGGQAVLVKVQITADPLVELSGGVDNNSPTATSIANTCTVITPTSGGHDINSLIAGWDSNWTSDHQANYGCLVATVTSPGHVVLGCRRNSYFGVGQQDATAYLAVFDPGNGMPLGSGGTGSIIAGNFTYNFPNYTSDLISSSYSGIHTYFNCNDAGTFFCWQVSYKKGEQGAVGMQKLWTQMVDYCADVVQPSDPSMCSSWVAGLPYQATGTETWIHVTSSWDMSWGTQPAGYQTGDVVSDCATVSPNTCLAIDRWFQTFRVGDFLSKDYTTPEFLQILDVGTIDGSGRPLKVKRGIFDDGSTCSGPNITRCEWAAGVGMYGQGESGSSNIWDYASSPTGSDPAAFKFTYLPGGGHQSNKNTLITAAPTFVGYPLTSLSAAPQIMSYTDAVAANINIPETFAGITSNGQPDCLEGHPSDGYIYGSGATSRAISGDINPLIGGGSDCLNNPTGATLVSWPIYKFSTTNLHPKQFDTMMTVGPWILQNISGPGSLLTTASSDFYKGCYVLIAGECYAGSVAGEFYFSAPNAFYSTCSNLALNYQDPCVGDGTTNLGNAVGYVFPTSDNDTDPNRSQWTGGRTVLTDGMIYRGQPNTSNCEAFPSTGFTLSCASGSTPNNPRTFTVAPTMLPPPTYDGVDRTTFVPRPLTISSAPMGTAKIAVKIAYNYDGSNLYCSRNRAEACYVTSATVNETTPYLWESEWSGEGVTWTGSPLTINLPSVYGEVLYSQPVYLDSMGSVISTGTLQMEAADSGPSASGVSRRGPRRSAGPRISR